MAAGCRPGDASVPPRGGTHAGRRRWRRLRHRGQPPPHGRPGGEPRPGDPALHPGRRGRKTDRRPGARMPDRAPWATATPSCAPPERSWDGPGRSRDDLTKARSSGSRGSDAAGRIRRGGRALQSQDARRVKSGIPWRRAAPDQDVGVQVDASGPGDGAGVHGHLPEPSVVGAQGLEDRSPEKRVDVALDDIAVREREPKAMAVESGGAADPEHRAVDVTSAARWP